MPMFHDGWGTEMTEEEKSREHLRRKKSEEEWSRLTEKEERERSPPTARDLSLTAEDGRPISREELIERIKRGESPTWTFRHGYGGNTPDKISPKVTPRQSPQLSLLPSVELEKTPPTQPEAPSLESTQDNYTAGLDIERPRSALHSGDFGSDRDRQSSLQDVPSTPLATSPPAPWLFTGPRSYDERPPSRSRVAGQPLSHFVLMPPTSPLVQAVNNTDLDYPVPQRSSSRSPDRETRRRTFSPQSFQEFQAQCFGPYPGFLHPLKISRRDYSHPYQAHQPRRSISSITQLHPKSTPQTPLSRSRGASQSSDISPLHHAPMVGSYEESILRGRMSTTPSRPLNFIAQIGVLGKGKCRPSLRCPPHVTVPFPAVFYSYNSGNGRILDNQPSPYVGLIDIENSLPPAEESSEVRRRRRYSPIPGASDADDANSANHSGSDAHARLVRKRRERFKKRSQSPKAPPGGSYRIPQQGQLQIVIKNPNKTAVKLFLVPYDLSDMEAGQKTFIRQRSYSTGPIIDMPIAFRKNLGTDRPEAALSTSEDPNDRPTLRYLIHIHICCTGKGRYYLYKSVRVVFANRVPDGKEKLRNEVQLPEPKYSIYKPTRDSHGPPGFGTQTSALGAALAAEKAARRRSTPFNFAERLHGQRNPQHTMDEIDGISSGNTRSIPAQPLPPWSMQTVRAQAQSPLSQPTRSSGPIRPIPFTLSGVAIPPTLTSPSDMVAQQMELDSPQKSGSGQQAVGNNRQQRPMSGIESSKADASSSFLQGRHSPSLGSPRSPIEGLLAKTLRSFHPNSDALAADEDRS